MTAKKSGLEDVLPLTPLQEGLMFHALYDDDAPDVYTVSMTLELTGPLDAARLREAGQALLDRHANLRAGFRRTAKGTTVAAIPTRARLPWTEHEVATEQEAERLVEQDRGRRFDMARPPLLRMMLVRVQEKHRLTIAHHHILLDGWSAPLLVKELLGRYARPGELPPPPPYKAYLAWLSTWDKSAAVEAWRNALAGLDEPTRVAPAAGPPTVPVPESTSLDPGLSKRLTELARGNGLTLNTVVQAAWGLLLARTTGRDDVVFGATVSGRPPQLPGVEEMIGLFINTVPVRVRIDPAEPASALLRRLQDEQAALIEHQYLGLADIQRVAGHGELFDTLTVFESYPSEGGDPVPGLTVTQIDDQDATHYPLVLVAEPGERIGLELRHRPDMAAAPLLARLTRILTAFADAPAEPVGRIGLLSKAEHETILGEWAGSIAGIEPTTFPKRFAEMAAAFPGNTAIVLGDEQVSYAELDARSARLAAALAARGAGPGDVVAVALPRSIDLITALVGVLRSGAAYLALDLDHPADRLGYMIEDARPVCAVTRADLPGDLPVVDVAAHADGVTPRAPGPLDAAYVIYTSGSTGRPKGVVVTHEGASKLLATQQRRLGLDEHTRGAFFASPSFDLAYWELCWALLSGGTLVVVPAELRVPGTPLVDYLTKHEITQVALPPSVLGALPAGARLPLGINLLVGTEEVPARLAERFATGRRMFNAYGPTETSVNATLWEVPPVVAGTVPIGVPDPGQLAYVLDNGLNPVPPGTVGELYLGGLGLARGYLDRPGLTAGRFLADPYQPGRRMYRTGDLVRWTGEGALKFAGRADHQVKIRGFRVELGEIEAVVARRPGVRQAAVVLRADNGVKRIVAYVVGDADLAGLRAGVAAVLPDYMVPGAFVALDRLPVSVNGKLDRTALPAPDFSAGPAGRPPRTPREKLLCDVFADVLGVPELGIDDDFFALGGDSIMSMRLVGRARAAGLLITPRQVFQNRTPARLVAVAGTVTGADAVPAALSLITLTEADRRELAAIAGDVREVLPLSPLQSGLLFQTLLDDSGPGVYTVRMVLDLTGPIDADRLKAAAQALLDRHGNLAASFHNLSSGTAVSVVPAQAALAWTVTDDWDGLIAEQGSRFDPAAGPLIRFALARTGPDTHRLLITLHHLLLDGWSRGPFLAELSALYRSPSAPATVRPYRDYLAWLAGQDRRTAEQAWAAALQSVEPTRVVPGDDRRAAPPPEVVEAELPAGLITPARARGLTLNTVVQAAWALLLARLTGRDDVVFGATVSGRPAQLPGVEDMIGLFINTVPVRVRIDPAEPAHALLDRLQDEQSALMEHQYLSLSDIQRAAGGGELFDTLLVFENYPDGADDDADGGLPITGTDGSDATHYPLTLIAEPGDTLRLAVEYRPDLFTAAHARRLAAALCTLVAGLASGLDVPVGRLGLLTELPTGGQGETRAVRVPAALGGGPAEQTLPELLTAQAAATPDATAVIGADGTTLTYRELGERTDRLARVLAAAGAAPETVVAIALPRSLDLVVAIHAVVKSGAAYLPLDLDHPPARIDATLADAQPVAVLRELPLDGPEAEPVPAGPHHPAYVIYTSGSTGAPKGVVVEHAGIVNRLRWMQHEYGLTRYDRVLQKTPAGFDVSVWEYFWPLITGATLVVARPDGHRDPAYLAELIRREAVTTVHFVPSMLAAFLADPAAAACTSLRRVVCSGEALPTALADRFHALLPRAELHNLYGPTEASVDVTSWPAARGTGRGTVPIGGPVWNTRVSVLDAFLRPVPVGVPGELYLSGVQLARGYRNRPDLTAERFVADPYGLPGERMYRTGDQVRWDSPGVLEFLGRGDGQVKVRGLRVELGEIEAAVAAQPGVTACVVLLWDARHLVAYTTGSVPVDEDALRRVLPGHMVPAAFVRLDALPVSVNGKLERAALPAPDFAAASTGTAARNPREQLLCDLFAQVLGVPSAGVDDDFFRLGGDSIVSIQLAGRARAAGLSLTLRQIFQLRTPAALAAAAGAAFTTPVSGGALVDLTDAETAEIAALGIEVAEVLPLSPLQAGLLFHAAFDDGGLDLYTVQMVFDLPATVDPDRLRAAAQALLRRHANLRASFHQLGSGRPVAVVARGAVLPWASIDLSSDDAAWEQCLAEEGRRFDPAVAPLLRMLLVRTRDAYRLVLTHQHMLLDGWSRGPLLDQLAALYAGPATAEPPPYRDFLAWLATQDRAAAEDAWRHALEGVSDATRLAPADPQREPVVPSLVEHELPLDVTADLTALARKRGLTLNTLVQAAWGVVLGRLTGRDDVLFGATVSGRPAQLPGVEEMIGLFINTVPVRVRIDPAEPAHALLDRVRDEQSALLDHQYLGLADIQRLAGAGELFDTLMIVENYPDRAEDGPDALLSAADAGGRDATHYPLTWVIDPGSRLRVTLEHRADLFPAPVATRLVRALTAVLTAFATDPARPVGRLGLVIGDHRAGWNPPPPASEGDDPTIAQIFERQAAESPYETAVVCGDVRWSFAELNERANRLARVLVDRGAGPEDVVALALPRTADAITAILAVLKSGAAYLPLDPAYPKARLDAMIEDARPKLVVTTTGTGVDGLLVDDPAVAAMPGHDLPARARAQHPAYVIYTSGSTGRPKGVVVTHRNLVNLFRGHREQLHRPAQVSTGRRHLRVGHAWSFSFDASWQPQLWLLDGHALHLVTEETQRDPELLARQIRDEGIDFIELTPSHFAQVADAGLIRDGRCPLAAVGVGGEAIPPALWARLGSLPGTSAFNLYGPTEATVDALSARIADAPSPVIGRAVAGARAYVLDNALRHAPVGVPGELYVAGLGLARGYLGRPGPTSERFVADPYGPAGDRMYRTGDLVRWTEEGQVEYLGRIDEQVKIRGFRVELGEIESVLAGCDGVAEAVVVAFSERPVLAGYVVAPASLDLDALRAAVAAVLPDHMVPAALIRLDRLPTLANGKINRAGLPAPSFGGAVAGRAPATAQERILASVVATALGLPSVDAEADFFRLGGDSIVAMRLVGLARAAGLRITPRQIFAERTVERLATVAAATASAQADDGVGTFPLTPVMHWLSSVDGPTNGFNQSAVVRVPADLGWERLLTALQALVDKHDMLRARFAPDWTATVPPAGSSRAADWTTRVDATGLNLWETVAAQAAIAQAALDPSSGRMIRAVWLDTGPSTPGRLILLVHHLVVDGVSWRVLLPELGALWRDPASTVPAATSFRRWATGLAAQALDPARVAELPMWTEIVAKGTPLPVRRPLDPAVDVAATLLDVTLALPVDVTEALLTRVPAALGASINDVLLGALGVAVNRWNSSSTVVVALEGHGREEHLVAGADLSGTVGWFTNIFPIALDTTGIDLGGGGEAVARAVARVREHLASLPDNGMGYGLLRYLNPATAPILAAQPHPPIQFNYMGRFDFPEAADWEYAPEAEAAENGADDTMPETYELVVNAQTENRPGGPRLTATWAWPSALLTEESVGAVARLWFTALQDLVTHLKETR